MGASLTDFKIAGGAVDARRRHTRASQTAVVLARTSLVLGTRLAFGAFWLVTSAYCLLVYVPFAYFGFIQNPLLTWIPLFTRYHAIIYALLCGAVTVTLIPDLRNARTRNSCVGLVSLNAIAAIYLWRHPAIAGLTPDFASYLWSLVSLFPLVWLAVLDLTTVNDFAESRARTLAMVELTRASLAAVMLSMAFTLAAISKAGLDKRPLPGSIALRGLAASLSFHLVIFVGFAVVLHALWLVSRRTPWPRQLYFALAGIFVWLLCTQALRILVLPTISFEGAQANILAAAVAFAVVLYTMALVMRFQPPIAALGKLAGQRASSSSLGLLFALLLAAAYGIPALIGHADWDFVLQTIATLATWALALQALGWVGLRMPRKAALPAAVLLGCAAVGGCGYVRSKLDNQGTQAVWNSALDTYAGADISFKTAYSIVSRSLDHGADNHFDEFLKQNTNLGRDVVVGPVDTRLVASLQPSNEPKPNIFFFVIDSLRQDSTSPYNPAIDYTPEIGSFAKDSVVLENAFTRYGGTALSEPAIWVGAMQLHKQYIRPFYPMNNLQKLLDVDGYQSYISLDPILSTILRPSPSITELDNDTTDWGALDFVPTLKKLETAIDARADLKKPIFAYSQPQNVHTLTLERSRIKGGRKAVTEFELRRMDAAFGEFVRFLQQRGLYDNSIIILTADHGDSYGEFGRYGHSTFLFPEVIRIPLIVHLPRRMRGQLCWNVDQLAFNTDITPSLYYLLGHRPIIHNELFGRPLFTQTRAEQTEYARPYYLLVSSYAPVYAILGGGAKSLFIADAVNSKQYFYDLAEDPLGSRNHATAHSAKENEPLIRRQIELIDRFYGWHSPQQAQ